MFETTVEVKNEEKNSQCRMCGDVNCTRHQAAGTNTEADRIHRQDFGNSPDNAGY